MIRLLLVLLAACSSLDDIDKGVCGNGVLEAGEDCDSRDPLCDQCGIRCEFTIDDTTDDEACAAFGGSEGYVCGADDFCHAPLGRFHQPSELSTATETIRASDINGDGYGDLVVQSSTAIRVLFGNPEGEPTTAQQVLTPIARGRASYANIDADDANTLDILLPAADGIVAYTAPYQVLSPYPFPSIVAGESQGRPYYSHNLEDQVIGFVGLPPGAPSGAPVAYVVRDVSDAGTPTPLATALVCGATDLDFRTHDVDVFTVNANYHLFATTFRQGGASKLCVLAIAKVAGNYSVTELTVSLGVNRSPASRPVLAPIGAGACPSIVIREQVGMQAPGDVIAFAGSGTLSCSYSGVPQTRTLATDKGDPVGWAPLVPADSGTGATVAMAMQSGVYAVPASGPLVKLLYLADRPLHSIRFADIDDDTDVDIIAGSATNAELVEDIDVLSRFDMGFVRYRFDTDGPVDLLTIGDYDGNGIPDVGYVQTRVIGGEQRYELMIAYATGDTLLPGVSAGTFGRILSLLPADIPDSNDPFNIIGDLVVLYTDEVETAITILHGSPQRTMLAFFDPRISQAPTIFRGIVAGNFNAAAGTTGLDLIAVEDGELGAPRVWRSNGPTGGEVTQMVPSSVAQLADCTRPLPTSSLCIDGAQYVAFPVDATRDRVIGFGQDKSGDLRIITFDPHADPTTFPSTAWPSLPALPPKARIRSADVVMVGGTPMIAISTFQNLEFHLVLCAVEPDGLPSACYDVGERISTPERDLVCTHATAARVRPFTRFMKNPTITDDLIVLCNERGNAADTTALYQVLVENREPVRATELHRVGKAREVRSGDIDGNGIVDFLTIDRESAVPTIRIYRQCTAREEATCGG